MIAASSQTKSDGQRRKKDKEGWEQPIQTLDEEPGMQTEEDQLETPTKMRPREEVEEEQKLEIIQPSVCHFRSSRSVWTPKQRRQREEQRRKLETELILQTEQMFKEEEVQQSKTSKYRSKNWKCCLIM
jgi:hypothetical protein